MQNPFFQSKQFIFLMAAAMGSTAMGLDSVLPIFPEMSQYFHLPDHERNRIQHVIFVFLLGFAVFQLIFGVLADVVGRKILMLFGLGIYSLATVAVFFVHDFETLLWLRLIQGAGLAAPRVLTMCIVRDVSHGQQMSRLMSFIMMVFLVVPVIAPAIGQASAALGNWQSVFLMLLALGVILFLWIGISLPETLPRAQRLPLRPRNIGRAIMEVMSDRVSICYMLMIGILYGMLITYLGQAEQIMQRDIFKMGKWFPLFFALVVIGMISANLTNAKIVLHTKINRIITRALQLIILVDVFFICVVVRGDGVIPLAAYILILIVHFFAFGLAMPNLNAMIMEPFQHIAGTASSLVGAISSIVGIAIAQFAGGLYNQTLYPLAISFFASSLLLWCLFFIVKMSPQSALSRQHSH